MNCRRMLIAATLATVAFTGCERKPAVVEVRPATPLAEPVARTKTLETSQLGVAIDAYERTPTEEHRADVRKAFAELDGEVAELEALVAQRSGTSRDEATKAAQPSNIVPPKPRVSLLRRRRRGWCAGEGDAALVRRR
jgi:hypothetical protein